MLVASLRQAVNKIEALSERLNGLKNHIQVQNKKIEDLEKNYSNSSGKDSVSGSSRTSGTSKQHKKVGESKSSKLKKDRVQEEKLRQLKLLKEKLKTKGKNSDTSNTPQNSATSDEDIDLKKIKKKKIGKCVDLKKNMMGH